MQTWQKGCVVSLTGQSGINPNMLNGWRWQLRGGTTALRSRHPENLAFQHA